MAGIVGKGCVEKALASPSWGNIHSKASRLKMLGHYSPTGHWSRWSPSLPIWLPAELSELPLVTGLQASREPQWEQPPPPGEAAADTMETPPQSPFLQGIYEVPDTILASPPGNPQLALDHIPASRWGPRERCWDTRQPSE